MAEELGNMDRLILKGISLGYKSSRQLSKKINIDENTLNGKILELNTKGYIANKGNKVPLFDKIISILGRDEFVSCGQLTGKGCNALGEEGLGDIIAGFKPEKGVFKHAHDRPKSFISKLIDGAWFGSGFFAFIGIMIVALVLVMAIAIFIIIKNPSYMGTLLDIVFSIIGRGKGILGF